MNLDQIRTELGNYFRVNSKEIQSWVYAQPSRVFEEARTITRVKGKFPAIHSVTDHVVQGFAAVWNELGTTKFRVNELTAYHQKVNFPIIPSEVEASWLGEMDDEDKSLENKSISRYIAQNELKPKVIEDVADLVINGVYNSGALGTYGNSMNGLIKILQLGIADATNSMYKIPLSALTDSNIVEQVTFFEQQVPAKVRKFMKKLYMSTQNAQRYILDYENTFGTLNLNNGSKMRTRLNNWEIVGLDDMDGSDFMFCTPPGNMLKLIDKFDAPQVTDIQVADYKLKIFMEWWLGIGFWSNQLVCVSVTQGSGSGLTIDNSLYFA